MDIELRNISKRYSKKIVLDSVSFEMHEGIYGLLGKNGAGKTTLVSIILGLIKSDEGEILINNRPVVKKDFIRSIGYLPQYPIFYKSMTVIEFMHYISVLKGVSKKDSLNQIEQLLEKVNLSEEKNTKIGALSGGMRQRLGIAQSMLNHPQIVILDEPTAGLDPYERIRFRNLISQFADDKIIIVVTHIVNDLECIANNIIILNNGKITCNDSPDKLEQSIDGYVWEYSFINDHANERSNLIISNYRQEQKKKTIRYISNSSIYRGAISVPPNLEDVFLYYTEVHNICD